MRKIIIILVCFLLIASALPRFARGHGGHGGHHESPGSQQAANEHRWHGSTQHPSFHGRRGWGQAPGKGPTKHADDPSKPPDDPVEDPGDKPGTDPVGTPGDKGDDGIMEGLLILDLRTGSFPG
jgi:hypothetical protein